MLPFPVRLHEITGHANEYLFLNVKRGNDELIALHDRLYSGMLAPFLAPEFTFAPHLTIGRLADHQAFRAALREAHAEWAMFEATVREVAVHAIEDDGSGFTEMVMGFGEGAKQHDHQSFWPHS